LDGINLPMADVRDGEGPFLSVFLKGSQHWDPGAIGLAMGASSIAGVAAGIFGVISVLIAFDLMQGTGRFNLAQGLMALAVGIGATLSNATEGYVVQWFGYQGGFLYLAPIACCALAFFALLMPETKDAAEPAPQADVQTSAA
jgi:predicted MFS family arabinose efflux permease